MSHQARKRFGQNFLVDDQIVNRIVSTISPKKSDNIVEIGPGKGALTFPLLEHLDHLSVIEIDRDLISLLKLKKQDKLTIYEADALKFDYGLISNNLRIVGNLPYNISSPLLFHLLSSKNQIIDMTFMLQKEVVDRIVAKHGSKTYGRLSVMMQTFFEVESMFTVPKESFDPQPKIESAILYLKTRTKPLTREYKALRKNCQSFLFTKKKNTEKLFKINPKPRAN